MTSAVITAEPVVDSTSSDFEDDLAKSGLQVKTTPAYEPSPEAHQPKKTPENSLDDKIARILGSDTTTYRRTNPKARSMRRNGDHYQVRKDHGTTARCKEISAESSGRHNRTLNSAAAKRKEAKLLAFSGNPRVVTKLKRLGDLLVD
ncbi:MAG TPA: hypothetical protein VL481_03000 [Verrucomicrobiae bacterium]|nr:hypothetical protein [Verrucomicrobiae bacterium]